MKIPPPAASGLLFLVSGPTGSGKTTLCEHLVATHPEVERVVTCTTRPPREGEQAGIDYHFLSNAEFDAAVENDEFLEWARVHTSRYGTRRTAIFNKLARNVDLVVSVDIQGAKAIRQAFDSHSTMKTRLVTIFVLPPSMETIYDRMLTRGKETMEQIERRMKTAIHEVEQWPRYDYCLVSGTKEEDYARFEGIFLAEKCRATRLKQAAGVTESRTPFNG